MQTARIIPCLDVDAGRVVKGVNFVGLRDAGDPVELAARYDLEGADELVFLDITASSDARETIVDVVTRTAEQVFIPFTVGGGIRSVGDARRLLRAGADKTSVNTAAVERPELVAEIAAEFGSQCVVVAIDSRRSTGPDVPASGFEVFTHGGRRGTGIDVLDWARQVVDLGAGEILLTSMDRDGTREGFDLPVTAAVAAAVTVPVIASGGVGSLDHLVAGIRRWPRGRRAGGLDLPLRRVHGGRGQGPSDIVWHRGASGAPIRARTGGGPMMIRRLTLVLVAIALTAAGCSDDDDDLTAPADSDPTVDDQTTTEAPDPPAQESETPADETTTTVAEAIDRSAALAAFDGIVLDGPIAGTPAIPSTGLQDLPSLGYAEEEYFVTGDARSFSLAGERSPDGLWTAEPGPTAAFSTRAVLRRPVDPAVFSGTVIVEWLNVSGGGDGDPDWGYMYQEMIREGHAWIGVSAQAVGVIGGTPVLGESPATGGLVGTNPERYGTLVHPGDAYSFDMYSAAAAAITRPDGPMGDLDVAHVVAAGESQSAFFLTTYINGVHPITGLFDGFLVHSRGGGAPTLDGDRGDVAEGDALLIRTDLDDPVLIFETETDMTLLGYAISRQDDTESVRTWEVAGTAHADAYLIEDVYGVGPGVDTAGLLNCTSPLNDGPQHEVLMAALHAFVDWVDNGTLPPTSPRLELTADGSAIERDPDGNALGGIRTPLVDVPVATLSGEPAEDANGFCTLFGSTTPFSAESLVARYGTVDDYVAQFTAAAEAATDAGFVLPPEAQAMIRTATDSAPALFAG